MKNRIKEILIKLGYYSEPDFMIIGAQKAGTSGLFTTLNKHSYIVGSQKKEPHYFDNDLLYLKNNFAVYHKYFPLPHNVPKNARLFEATPIYLFHPEVPYRLFNYNPKLKLIILLRNPAYRAFSAWTMYHHHFKTGIHKELYDPRSFSEAITNELQNIEDSGYYNNIRSYVKRGIYHYQIEAVLQHFNKNQLLFIESNALKNNNNEELSKIQSFIGVPYENLSLIESNRSKKSEIDIYANDIEKLKEFYEPHNQKLYDLLGVNFKWT